MAAYSKSAWKSQYITFSSVSGTGVNAFDASYSAPISYPAILYQDLLNGVTNPRWKEQIREGQDATTSMSAATKTFKIVPGILEVSGNTSVATPTNPGNRFKYGYKGTPYYEGYTPSGSFPESRAVNSAAGHFYAKVRDANSTFKGMVATGEGRQAVKMIKSRGEQILAKLPIFTSLLKKAKKRYKLVKDLRKALADNYLEIVFGWLPLISDIEDAYHAATRTRPVSKMVVGRGYETSVVALVNGQVGFGHMLYDTMYRNMADCKVKYYSRLTLRQGILGKLDDFGFNIREFVPTLYEIMPWSFLLDYFGNLNEMITAGCYASLVNGQVNRTVVKEYVQVYATSKVRPTGPFFELAVTDLPSRITIRTRTVNRVANVGLPIVWPAFKLPDGPKKLINMAALAIARKYKYYP
jgi:hypothetical protein